MRFGTVSGWNDIISSRQYYVSGNNGNWVFRVNQSNQLELRLYNGETLVFNNASTATLSTNTWYHVAMTRDSNNVIDLWLDGTSVKNFTDSNTFNSNDARLTIGRSDVGNSQAYSLGNSYMEDIRITKDVAIYTETFNPSAWTEKFTLSGEQPANNLATVPYTDRVNPYNSSDIIVTAAGGLVGEVVQIWKPKQIFCGLVGVR